MKKLKKNEIAVIKLSQDKILELIREEVFGNYKDFAKISNKDVISTVCYVKEKDGSVSMIAGFQPWEDAVDRAQAKKPIDPDFLRQLDLAEELTGESTIYSIK